MRSFVCAVILASCTLAGACHPRPPRGVRTLGDRIAAVGNQIAPMVDIQVVAKMRPVVRGAAEPPVATSTPAPVTTPSSSPRSPAPTSDPSPAPPTTIDRVDASRPTVFVLRGQTQGGQAICETHATSDTCNTRCTSLLRANAFQTPAPTTPTSCSCLEQDSGC